MIIRASGILIFFIAAAFLSLLYFYYPATSNSFYPGCALYSLTGFYCPACGSQRAFSELLHGHIWGALRDNLLFVAALTAGMYLFTKQLMDLMAGNPARAGLQLKPAALWLILAVIIGFWILRNLPPFFYLRPV